MTSNVCSGWDNSNCKGTDHCPPRCPRYIKNANGPVLIEPCDAPTEESLLAMYDSVETTTMALPLDDSDERKRWLRRLSNGGWSLVAVHAGDDR